MIEARSTTVGNGAGGSGTLVLTGDGTTLDNTQSLHVGYFGEGELQIQDGAKAFAGSMIVLGSEDGSFGRLVVSGQGSRLQATPGSAGKPYLWVGERYGAGEMSIELGGVVQTGASIIDTGSVSVDGVGSLWETGYLSVIDDDSTLTITAGGRVTSDGISIGDFRAASASVDGATSRLESTAGVVIGNADASFGRLTLSNGATAVFDDYLSVGEYGSGILVVESGATLTSDSGYLGFEGEAKGTALVTGEDSRWDSTLFVLGTYDRSNGTLIVSDGGVASAGEEGEFLLGYADDASGTIAVGAASGEEAQAAGMIEGARLVFAEGSGLVFNHTGLLDGGNLHFAPDLAGAGIILHENGTTHLDGDGSEFSGLTSVTGGRLMVMNGLGGSVEVRDGGFLGGVSTIGSGAGTTVTIGDGGTLGPGDPVGRLTIDGNLVFETGSSFEVGLRAGQISDSMAVTGTVAAAGGRVSVVTLDPETSYANGATYRILDAQGGFLSEFGGIDSESAFLQFILDYSQTGLDLIVQAPDGPIDFSEVARTRNQRATALVLNELAQTGPSLTLYNALAMLGEGAARNAFDRLSGEIHASLLTGLIDDSRHVRNAANDRIRAAFAGVGASNAPVLAYGPDGPAAASATSDRGIAGWATAFGSWSSTDGDGNAAALDRATGGLLFGADALVTGDWRLGLLAGYSHSAFDVEGRASSGSSDNYHVGLYGGTVWKDVFFRSGLGYSWHDVGTDRSVDFTGFADRLRADYHAYTLQAFGELATRLDVDGVRFEPFANLAYVQLDTDGFTETGEAAALSSSGDATKTILTTLGLRAEHAIALGATEARLTGLLGWQHASGDIVPVATQAFTGSDPFTVSGAPIARDSAVVAAGLTADFAPEAAVSLSYRGEFSNGGREHGVQALFGIHF